MRFFFTISSQPRELSPTRTLKWTGRYHVQIIPRSVGRSVRQFLGWLAGWSTVGWWVFLGFFFFFFGVVVVVVGGGRTSLSSRDAPGGISGRQK